MKKIIFKKIDYTDFKGQINQSYNFLDGRNTIKGKNGSGKTSLLEAITYTLFGKDLFGSKVFHEPIDKEGNVKKDYNQKLELVMVVDGVDYIIKKAVINNKYKELSINDKPYKLRRDFEDELSNIIGLTNEEFLSFSNPKYFINLENKVARNYVVGLTKNVNEYKIIDSIQDKDYAMQIKTNIDKGITLNELLSMKEEEIKGLLVQINANNLKLESKKETLQSATNIKTNVNVESLTNQRVVIEDKLKKAQENNQKIIDQETKIAELKRESKGKSDEIFDLNSYIETYDDKIEGLEKAINNTRKDYDTLNLTPVNDKCIVCGSTTDGTKAKATAHKVEELDKLDRYGLTLKKEIESVKQQHKGNVSRVKTLQNELDIINTKLSGLTYSIEKIDTVALQQELNTINKAIGGQDIVISINNEIKALESQRKTDKVNLDKLEQEKLALVEISKQKAQLIEGQVNDKLNGIKVKLFEIKKNGNVRGIFTITADGIDFARMNNAKQITSGVELVNYIQGQKDISLPIFVDNAEAVNKLQETKSQSLELYVSESKLEVNK